MRFGTELVLSHKDQYYSAMVAWVTVHLFGIYVQVSLIAQFNHYKTIYNIFRLEGKKVKDK